MADKRVCGVCREHGHSSSGCPRMGRTVASVTRSATPLYVEAPPVTGSVTVSSPIMQPVTKHVTELEQENAFLRAEIARLTEELAALKPKTHAARQKAYRERRGHQDD